jgi:hypothetical protein
MCNIFLTSSECNEFSFIYSDHSSTPALGAGARVRLIRYNWYSLTGSDGVTVLAAKITESTIANDSSIIPTTGVTASINWRRARTANQFI